MIGEHAVVQFVTERDGKHSVAPRGTRVVVVFIGWLDVGMEFRGKLFALFGNPLVFDDAFSSNPIKSLDKRTPKHDKILFCFHLICRNDAVGMEMMDARLVRKEACVQAEVGWVDFFLNECPL